VTSAITFILPSLFEHHCYNYLDDDKRSVMQRLTGYLARSNKQTIAPLHQWLCSHYQLDEQYHNSAHLMVQGAELDIADATVKKYWLRADPVMLTATHNGILCRGNRLLNLTKPERESLQLLINDYLKEQSMQLILSNSHQGYLTFSEQRDCQFTPLAEVIGQDITHRLPTGDNDAFWHRLIIT